MNPLTAHATYVSTGEWDVLLADALSGRGLQVAFQPVVDLQGGCVVGYEALARFSGPDGLRPDHWFHAARARGVVARLDAAALMAALAWRRHLPKGCFLSVNLEPDSVGHPSVETALRSAGDLDGLMVELTEHIPIEPDGYLEDRLLGYRALGVLIALDDAGSGYASLQHILRFRPAVLKLDRALVDGIDKDPAKLALVEMLGYFAERIGGVVLAEGVETLDEATVLRELGVPLAQGYFFARPCAPWIGLSEQAESFFNGSARVERPLLSSSWQEVVPLTAADGSVA